MSEVRRLRYFLAVADELNFTGAAERLHVAQPTLSRQIRLLERELGVELLRRSTHSVELTDIGEQVRERARAIVDETDALWAFARGVAAGEQWTVLIGHTPSIAYKTAPTLIDAVAGRLPDLDVHGGMWSYAGVLDRVRDGSVAVGLVRSGVDDDHLVAQPVRRLRQGVLVATDDPLASAAGIRVADLTGRPILLHEREANPGHHDEIVALCRDAGFEPTLMTRTAAFDPAQSAVRRGEAVSVQADLSDDLRPSGLRWIPFDPPVWFEVQLVVRPAPRPPVVDRVVDAMLAVRDELGWLGS